jgi:2-amino-4-hydroxy-6-hydroxymethyldihydropteridine diphosphokinase
MAGRNKRRPTANLATVGIGSNLGNREATISGAIRKLHERPGNRVLEVSSLFETEPVGMTDQPWFLNCVVQLETPQPIKDFLFLLKEIEIFFERERRERWGPRTLDLDLLLFNDTIYSDQDITVPHPEIEKRRFVLEPLCEIAPDLVHPVLTLSISNLLEQLEDSSRVIRLKAIPWKRDER